MAAAAKPPGLDGRITCPLCGGLIHPVAGKCKHCKEDLSAMRSGRPAAAAPLPALRGGAQNGNGSNGHHVAAAYAATSTPAPMPMIARSPEMHELRDDQPILPQRPTGRSVAAQRPRSMWKSWPMLVIVLATIAIVVAVVLMVWPPSSGSEGKRALQPPPAPERMDSNPLPPPGQGNNNGADPWGGHSQNTPVPPRQTPDPLPPKQPNDPNDLDDPFANLGTPNLGPQTDVMLAMVSHACEKMKACPDADQTFTSICDQFSMLPHGSPPTCAAAQRCMAAIDKLDCNTDLSNPMSVMQQMTDCSTAMTSC
jgi:hypothetical protein